MLDPIKLYLDEDVMSRDLVNALRSRAVDPLTAREAGLVHIPDHRHLQFAAEQHRALLTYNVRDFARLHAACMTTGDHHAGIILSDQLQVGVVLRRLLKLLNTRTAGDLRDQL